MYIIYTGSVQKKTNKLVTIEPLRNNVSSTSDNKTNGLSERLEDAVYLYLLYYSRC